MYSLRATNNARELHFFSRADSVCRLVVDPKPRLKIYGLNMPDIHTCQPARLTQADVGHYLLWFVVVVHYSLGYRALLFSHGGVMAPPPRINRHGNRQGLL